MRWVLRLLYLVDFLKVGDLTQDLCPLYILKVNRVTLRGFQKIDWSPWRSSLRVLSFDNRSPREDYQIYPSSAQVVLHFATVPLGRFSISPYLCWHSTSLIAELWKVVQKKVFSLEKPIVRGDCPRQIAPRGRLKSPPSSHTRYASRGHTSQAIPSIPHEGMSLFKGNHLNHTS